MLWLMKLPQVTIPPVCWDVAIAAAFSLVWSGSAAGWQPSMISCSQAFAAAAARHHRPRQAFSLPRRFAR
jgi:hypothetical protein